MVEHNATSLSCTSLMTMALSIVDRGYVLATGELVLAHKAANLLGSEELKRAYL